MSATDTATCSKCSRPAEYSVGMCKSHYQSWIHRQKAYGRWDDVRTMIDARPAHEHIRALRAAGVGLRRLEELTALPHRTLFEVSRREPGVITRTTAEAILSVPIPATPHDPIVAENRYIDPTGTIRRLQALAAIGYSARNLSRRCGHNDTYFGPMLAGKRTFITARLARKVDALFQDLQHTPGPDKRTRTKALELGWPPPLAWDEETIDDPAAQPNYGSNVRAPFLDRYRDARYHAGITDKDQLATAVGITRDSLDRQLERYRGELAP